MATAKLRFGVIREDGSWVFEPRFAHIGPFDNDRVAISDDGDLWGYADATGKVVIEKRFAFAYNFVSGAASVLREGKPQFSVIDRAGKPLKLWRDSAAEGRVRTSTGVSNRWNWTPDNVGSTKWGFIDESGATIAEPEYVYASSFFDGVACVRGDPTDYNVAYLGRDGKIALGPFESNDGMYFHEGWARLRDRGTEHWFFIDRTGKVVLKTKYLDMRAFYEGFAVVQANKAAKKGGDRLFGYIDKTGVEITKLAYAQAERFANGMASVANGKEKWGFIDKTGNEVIKPKFVEVGDFTDGESPVAPAAIEGPSAFEKKWGLIDRTGAWIASPTYASITNFASGVARFVRPKGKRWLGSGDEGLLDTSGRVVAEGYARVEWNDETPRFPIAVNRGGTPGAELSIHGGTWGFLDATGKEVIPCRFAAAVKTFANDGFGYASVAM
jgi:hypothetical protein